MPPSSVPKHQRGKKKGRPPAHQNTFAYAHNPKSKKTDHILGLPNLHVCQRCHEKIEWRKKYRKYKPRTQPGKCNICQQRRVMAAYHTICESCTKSDKAKKIVHEHLNGGTTGSAPSQQPEQPQEAKENYAETIENPVQEEEQPTGEATKVNNNNDTPIFCKGRACAMCVKDFTMVQDDKEEQDDPLNSGKRLTLRQRKTLERQKEKKQNKKTNDRQEEEEEEGSERDADDDDDNDDENDPFLKAVGGADNLLTGEAFQSLLMRKTPK